MLYRANTICLCNKSILDKWVIGFLILYNFGGIPDKIGEADDKKKKFYWPGVVEHHWAFWRPAPLSLWPSGASWNRAWHTEWPGWLYWSEGEEKHWNIYHSLATIHETQCGMVDFLICITMCDSHLQHVRFCISILLSILLVAEEHPKRTLGHWKQRFAFSEWIPSSQQNGCKQK